MTLLAPAVRRAPAVPADGAELALAALLAATGVWAAGPRPLVAALLWLAVVTPRLIAVDQAEHRLPDAIVLPGVPIALAAVVLDALSRGTDALVPVGAAVLYSAALLVLHEAGGMGLGDVKLALPLGLLAGEAGVGLASPLLALLAGGVWSAVVLARSGRGARIPFGPAMLLGAWAALFTA